jgi:hypothetical protein
MDMIGAMLESGQIDLVVIAAGLAYPAADSVRDDAAFIDRARQFMSTCQHCRVIFVKCTPAQKDSVGECRKG